MKAIDIIKDEGQYYYGDQKRGHYLIKCREIMRI